MIRRQSLRYQSYLLRCWEERDTDLTLWRFSLENPHTGQRRGFANLTELVIALHTELFENGAKDEAGPLPSPPRHGEGAEASPSGGGTEGGIFRVDT